METIYYGLEETMEWVFFLRTFSHIIANWQSQESFLFSIKNVRLNAI